MHVILQSIRRTKVSPTAPVYTATFLIDGTPRRYHAIVHVREANGIHFREPEMDELLANNFDQGRKVYDAIFQTHKRNQPRLPLNLGNLSPTPASRSQAPELEPA